MDADAIVIGAGAAGLAAARSLAERSLRVILVEARDRVGGRVWSRIVTRSATPAELGAEFIHGPAPETRALLREYGGAAIDISGESWVHERGATRSDDRDFIGAGRLLESAISLDRDQTVDEFLLPFDRDERRREDAQRARAFVEGFDAADPAVASAKSIAAEWHSGVDSVSARPLGGYLPLCEHLQHVCIRAGVQLQLAATVRRIVWQPRSVSVEVRDASGGVRTLSARAAVVTLPVGVLRHRGDATEVLFDPELPQRKLQALSKIEMGPVVKLTLVFRTAFWESVECGRYHDLSFLRGVGEPFATFWTQVPVRTESIVAWAGGPKARILPSGTAEIVELAIQGLGAVFGERLVREQLQAPIMHDWDDDPFARGAYSYLAVGAEDARSVLGAHVEGALFFAGEATSTDGQGGTVNGALHSGIRAAGELVAALE